MTADGGTEKTQFEERGGRGATSAQDEDPYTMPCGVDSTVISVRVDSHSWPLVDGSLF